MNGIVLNLLFLASLSFSSAANLMYIRGAIAGIYYHIGYISVILSGILTSTQLHFSRKKDSNIEMWHHITMEACQYLTILLFIIWMVTYFLVIYFL